MEIGVKYLPLMILLLLASTVCTTLLLTLIKKHVTDSLPYISDTGTLPPESCVFGQALNVLWVLCMYNIMYICYCIEEERPLLM
ncbi:hypothetical protein NQ314_014769 [Rhamnusium bicolor]|uniref:CWH43-like N-terminal domain-containing protein n=1 Tax=Rhamnusium bicolor TaxID=1586634 RepID=A0AAV8X176_9CUCU|nr:hypothetical protein NQ314_014769 [Rhamnusium bicolor]